MSPGPPAERISRLPAKVAVAVLDFLLGLLVEGPHRVGKPLRDDLVGLRSARLGAYRVAYEIDHDEAVLRVIRVNHRADVYRPR